MTAFQTLIHRLNTGSWGTTTQPSAMNGAAAALGAAFNPAGPSFIQFQPSAFMRPFDARNIEEGGEATNP